MLLLAWELWQKKTERRLFTRLQEMLQFRPIVFVIGLLQCVIGVAMLIPALVDASVGNPDWSVFVNSSATILTIGLLMALSTDGTWQGFSLRQAFVVTNLAWLSVAIAGAIPFAFSRMDLSLTDAFFESMSGITTTGSTVIVDLDTKPFGILLWRAILQWLGGIGIIVMAISILPILQVGGMQMFRIEAFDTDKVLPRAAQIAGAIAMLYVLMTATAVVVLNYLGMSLFDSVIHAMASISTGGFSSHDASVGHFQDPSIHWAITVLMIMGSIPFVLHLQVLRGDFLSLKRDPQLKVFLAILASSILCTTLWLVEGNYYSLPEALRHASFNITSIMTGTGYATQDFGRWGGFASLVIFILMFIGGCAGSTTCGIKIFRLQILYATARAQLNHLIYPNGVFFAYYKKNTIDSSVSNSVMSFFFLFAVSFILLAIGLGALGLDYITAFSSAATAIANVGPGLGEIVGPAGNFSGLPDGAKWLMSAGMLLGRLELFTVMVMMLPRFWQG